MEKSQMICIIVLLVLSVAVVVIPAAFIGIRRIVEIYSAHIYKKSGISRMIICSACLIVAVWCLRYAVGYFSIITANEDAVMLTWWEEIFNSMIHALQTFSMDEEYTDYIIAVKVMLREMFGADTALQIVYGLYASVLNFLSPIAGGAIILEILASVFPKVKLKISYMDFTRKKYIFSELNPASVALANSICKEHAERKKKRPVLIFTDSYVDDEKEKEYKLLLEARQNGAICVRDDIAHVAKPLFGKREYYLIDESEAGNLQALLGLVENKNLRYIKKSNIYLFVQSDAYVQIEKNINQQFKDDSDKKKMLKKDEEPVIIPIRSYRNLVQNLLVDVPLYEPLLSVTENERSVVDKSKLTVTILGNGLIGTEAFLNTYWFGQMLVRPEAKKEMQSCELTINVVSKDPEDVFWAKIDYINPEIKATSKVQTGNCTQNYVDIMNYDSNEGKNDPYCTVFYTEADVKIGGFWDSKTEETRRLLDSDYFIVALGNDSDNMSVAEKLRCSVSKAHFEAEDKNSINNVVIAYAVFDSRLSQTLNKQQCYKSAGNKKTDIYMHAFGSIDQVYSCDNVYMSQSRTWAEETGISYMSSQHNDTHVADNKNRSDSEDANYNYWANLARAMHVKYKVFSLGWINSSVFGCSTGKQLDDHREKVRERCGQFRKLAVMQKPELFVGDDRIEYADMEKKKHCLAWLEHRRWCAFTRIMGYQRADAIKSLTKTGKHKNMDIKLHSCLVETHFPGFSDDSYGKDKTYTDANGKVAEKKHIDFLDEVTAVRRDHQPDADNFKDYDYYNYEFDEFILLSDLAQELKNAGVPCPEKYCCVGEYSNDDYIKLGISAGEDYLVAVTALKRRMGKRYRVVEKNKDGEKLFEFCKTVKGAFVFRESCFVSRLRYRLAVAKQNKI